MDGNDLPFDNRQALENNIYEKLEKGRKKIEKYAIYKEVSEAVTEEVKEIIMEVLGVMIDDEFPLFFVPSPYFEQLYAGENPEDIQSASLPTETAPADQAPEYSETQEHPKPVTLGYHSVEANGLVTKVSPHEQEVLARGAVPVKIVEIAIHEYAHSLSSPSYHFYKKENPDDPKVLKYGVYNTRFGFIEHFPSADSNLVAESRIGVAMEELFAYATQHLGMLEFEKRFPNADTSSDSYIEGSKQKAWALLETMAKIAGESPGTILHAMANAKLYPDRHEQSLRSMLESSGREGLYDLLLTAPLDPQERPRDFEALNNKLKEKYLG